MTAVAAARTSTDAAAGSSRPEGYIVRAGDTLSGIAEKHGVTLDALVRANPQISNPNRIQQGQEIHLPSGQAQGQQTYTVRSGDNLSNIAERFGTSWQALAQGNHLSNPNLLHAGQELKITGAQTGGAISHTPAHPTNDTAAAPPHGGDAQAGRVTGALPSTQGMSQAQKYDTYAAYVNAHGDAQAKSDLAAGRQVILGLRNETSVNAGNGRGAYDDRIVVLQHTRGGGSVREFSANTEPSSQYEGRYGSDANGDGRRDLGQVAEGTNRFTRSSSGHLGNVLRPTGNVAIERDANHDGRITAGEGRGTSTDRSFLFHAGGNTNTGSAGCQTMRPGDFNTFWSTLGAGQKQFSYVLVDVDRHGPPAGARASAPQTGAATTAPAGGANRPQELGALSAQYETSGRGPGTVSSGNGDPGGVSYGSYQLAGNLHRPQQFLASEGQRWASEFGSSTPGSAAFTNTWKAIAAREPQAFQQAQHAFIERTHYNVQLDHVRDATGVDLSTRSHALQDVVWSTSVQHGPTTSVITRAMANVDAQGVGRNDAGYDRALINAIYDERGRHAAGGGLAYFSSASPDVQASVAARFSDERQSALAMLARER